ncbi:MAG: glycoside hydrolase family 26 protein, partial [Peptococcales bacterium]
TYKYNEYDIVDIAYYRPEIKTIEKDQNFYREVHLIDSKSQRVITFWAKTTGANYLNLKNELNNIAQSVTQLGFYTVDFPSTFSYKNESIFYEGEKLRLEIPVNNVLWGRFYPEVPFSNYYYQEMLTSEKNLDHKFEFIMTYKTFPTEESFPYEGIKRVYDEGRILMLTLQPFTPDLNWIAIPEIVAGQYDEKIEEWAKGLKSLNEPVFVRPLNEMNGDWDPWCAWFFGKDTDLYIKAWRHIVDIFRTVEADNVLFVWNPHDRSFPDFAWNNAHLYYPGDEYVDWVGLTGYNNGTSHPGDVWREFDEIYGPLYLDYMTRYANKPFMITEFSSNEIGGDKAAWIEKGMASLAKSYPNIKIATWFDGRDKLWQYELHSSPAAWESFKKSLKNEGFIKGAVKKTVE